MATIDVKNKENFSVDSGSVFKNGLKPLLSGDHTIDVPSTPCTSQDTSQTAGISSTPCIIVSKDPADWKSDLLKLVAVNRKLLKQPPASMLRRQETLLDGVRVNPDIPCTWAAFLGGEEELLVEAGRSGVRLDREGKKVPRGEEVMLQMYVLATRTVPRDTHRSNPSLVNLWLQLAKR